MTSSLFVKLRSLTVDELSAIHQEAAQYAARKRGHNHRQGYTPTVAQKSAVEKAKLAKARSAYLRMLKTKVPNDNR